MSQVSRSFGFMCIRANISKMPRVKCPRLAAVCEFISKQWWTKSQCLVAHNLKAGCIFIRKWYKSHSWTDIKVVEASTKVGWPSIFRIPDLVRFSSDKILCGKKWSCSTLSSKDWTHCVWFQKAAWCAQEMVPNQHTLYFLLIQSEIWVSGSI